MVRVFGSDIPRLPGTQRPIDGGKRLQLEAQTQAGVRNELRDH